MDRGDFYDERAQENSIGHASGRAVSGTAGRGGTFLAASVGVYPAGLKSAFTVFAALPEGSDMRTSRGWPASA